LLYILRYTQFIGMINDIAMIMVVAIYCLVHISAYTHSIVPRPLLARLFAEVDLYSGVWMKIGKSRGENVINLGVKGSCSVPFEKNCSNNMCTLYELGRLCKQHKSLLEKANMAKPSRFSYSLYILYCFYFILYVCMYHHHNEQYVHLLLLHLSPFSSLTNTKWALLYDMIHGFFILRCKYKSLLAIKYCH